MCYSIVMRDKAPKLAMLVKRLLEAIKGVIQAIQKNTESIHAAEERERQKKPGGETVHRIIAFDDKTVRDAKKESDRQYRTQNSIKRATWGAVTAACIYAGIAAWQGWEMRKATIAATNAANTAHDALILDQRAWVGVQGTESEEFSVANGFIVTVVFSNSGKTPAHSVQSSAGYKTSPVPVSGPTKKEIAALEFRPAQSIAPQSKYNMTLGKIAIGEGATPRQMEGVRNLLAQFPDIQKGNLVLYYYGILRYDDIFNMTHETQFCIYLADPKTKRVGVCDAFNDLN